MPLYEYECKNCHRVSEIFVTAERPPVCPHCESRNLEKQFSTFAAKGDSGGHAHSGGCGCGGHCRCH